MATSLNLIARANQIQEKLPGGPEYVLGKGLLQPANNTNSGPRKIMQGIQKEQSIQLCNPETAILMTGYENQFGELSSNFLRADDDYMVLDRIYKNQLQYWLIVQSITNGKLHVLEGFSYEHVTENYGHTLDTRYLDSLNSGNVIPKGRPVKKTTAYDDALNKCDGVNMSTVYLAMGETTEDPVILSESGAKKLAAPLYSVIQIIINDNDIPLNLYGTDREYKSFPDIGETVKDSILCAIRRERKDDEALYCQSVQHLKELMESDSAYIVDGEIIDIDVYCNNVDNLDIVYNTQIAKYWNEKIAYCKKIIAAVNKNKGKSSGMTYELSKLYNTAERVVSGDLYIKDKVFNNIVVQLVVKERKELHTGDKITDRYAGKGVISAIWPDEKMPKYYRNGVLQTVDAIYNSSTIVNRQNPGQSFETEFTFVGEKIVEQINYLFQSDKQGINKEENLATAESMVYRYLSVLAPGEAAEYSDYINTACFDDKMLYMESIMDSGEIYLAIKPVSGHVNIDMLRRLYAEFPWVDLDYLIIPQEDSNGNIRTIKSRRKIVTGKKYIYRLKQISEEKFSAVSLASTNLRGENTKTKANKQHRIPFANTPVKIGNMEIGNLMDDTQLTLFIVMALMMTSTSPVLRRSVYQLLVDDPFDPSIKFDGTNINATSRSAEIVEVFLKTMGLKLICEEVKPEISNPVLVSPVEILPGVDLPKTDLIEAFQKVPFYLENARLEELAKEYIKYKGKELLKDPFEIVNKDNKFITSPQFEIAKEKVIEIAQKCEDIDEVRMKIKEKSKKKLINVVYTMPVIIEPGGMTEYDEIESNNSKPVPGD